ncbi:fimbria/pilus outer membrane usher protein [Klebsiella aerogenes]|uniref:fimbria/pilus outer membrane usher protein n=1 Tax=Klebsiella aerogenes TaxID=548 RepID=UPI00149514B8|nr:fimbria/pilus outer membrane usher protein [Klebsiella aerogenes]NPE19833.1 fimbrial biogenesis outer membrane usher protein [Klebsiella aerogenes]
MIMAWQGKNIPQSYSSIALFQTPGYIGVAFLLYVTTLSSGAQAGEYFNPHLLEVTESSATAADLSWLSQDTIPPGSYNLDIYINDKYISSEVVEFKKNTDNQQIKVQPCIGVELLRSWSINTERYPQLADMATHCARLSVIPGLEYSVSLSQQRLAFSVPQAALLNRPGDYVPEEQWQQGINAGLLNYSLSGQWNTPRHGGSATESQFASLQPGINLGPWRLRNYSTFDHGDGGSHWQSVYSYLARDIHTLRSQFVLGNTYTSSGIYDSMNFTGLQLSSDKEMLPDSLHGFAPTIKGIARTTAEVTVYQNGYSIYKTTVAPGAFEIKDLYSTGSAGDLNVNIKESDGSEQNFIVPYASLAILQREGQLDYAFSSGKTRATSSGDKEYNFIQSTAAYGVSSNITLYAGLQQAEDKYTNILMGSGFNLGSIGALSFDASQSLADIKQNETRSTLSQKKGQSLRLRFSKSFIRTGTNFSVAGYRYSTAGYYSFQDFIDNASNDRDCCTLNGRKKGRFDASISQSLFGHGSLSLSLVNETYWDSSRMESLGIGYSGSVGKVSYFINYSYNRNVQSSENSTETKPDSDTLVSLTLSLPLGESLSSNYSMSSGRTSDTTHSVGLNGMMLADRSLNWNIQQGYNASNKSTSGNIGVDYQSSRGDISSGYGYDHYSNHYNYSLRGGMIAHAGGLTLSRFLGESSALIATPGVGDVAVRGQTNVTTDSTGYAIVPYIRPYHINNLSLDEQQIAGAEIDNVVKNVVPTRNAIVRVQYDTYIGAKAIVTLKTRTGVAPFGAIVTLEKQPQRRQDIRSNIVGDDGQVYMTGLQQKGTMLVKWGEGDNEQCRANYDLTGREKNQEIIFYQTLCH